MVTEYLHIIFFTLLAFVLTILLILLNYFFIEQNPDVEKSSAYECGFEPFNYSLQQFELKYYIVALLFLIFDLELIFILPWIVAFNFLTVVGFLTGLFFMFILALGFYYEWMKEGLNWD